jgi:hypothetical protein
VGRKVTWECEAATDSGTPSVDPLSARITCAGRVVAFARVSTKGASVSPGEYVTVTTPSPSPYFTRVTLATTQLR